ncbi:uncharacterized protein LOC143212735 [Lasioglossum baleicum]|uniref:uncharacterized protein LOC143212735 n=1 Tax=Lasioglossum baleicum TaxID=434251 RepID=UPI003FCE64F5
MQQTVSKPHCRQESYSGGMRQRTDVHVFDLRPEIQTQTSMAVALQMRAPNLQITLAHLERSLNCARNGEAYGGEYSEPGLLGKTCASQVCQVWQVLPTGDIVEEASEARVRSGAETELSDLREEIHPQVQIDPPLSFL